MEADHILYIAYPLLTVSETSAGGAEQVLWTLEREMARRGIETTVAASSGSRVSGELFTTGEPCTRNDDFERRNREHQDAIIEFVRQRSREGRAFDLVHDMSGSFWSRATEIDIPVLATLHLPRHFYPAALFENIPANVMFNCVSESQDRSFATCRSWPELCRMESISTGSPRIMASVTGYYCGWAAFAKRRVRMRRWILQSRQACLSCWPDRSIRFPITSNILSGRSSHGCSRTRMPDGLIRLRTR